MLCASALLAQRNFETPEAAAQALIDAAASNNTPTLAAIFGKESHTILTDGSPEQNKAARDEFASIANNRHSVRRDGSRAILQIGSEDWPFPIPIVSREGQWRFDASSPEQGKGVNELYAIEACAGYIGAQRQFGEQHRMQQFAAKLEELGDLIPHAMLQQPYQGYNFRVLSSHGKSAVAGAHDYVVQGTMLSGFALVAWPAEYGVSGTHTFIVSQDGLVYQKDVGPSGAQITKYDPDPSWKPVY